MRTARESSRFMKRRSVEEDASELMWCVAGQGRVALLGDSAHAMQPNLGQGGCMAIEDGYQLAVDLSEACDKAETSGRPLDIEGVLKVSLVI
jgi:zeaxanthin epoxidase